MYHVVIEVPGGSVTAEICYSRPDAEYALDRYSELFFYRGLEILDVYIVRY